MGSRYTGMIKCPYCKELTEYLYLDDFPTEVCSECGLKFNLNVKIVASKDASLGKP